MSRSRERADFQALLAVLAPSPWTEWTAALRARPPAEATHLAKTLLRAYRHGALTPERWRQLTGRAPSDPHEIDDAIRHLWEALIRARVVTAHTDDSPSTSPALLRRWAWQPRWYLMSQDEDLLLMDDALVPHLLDLARERRTPKRDYILEIVAHHARDTCTHAVWWAREIPETLTRVAAWAPAARSADAPDLAAYLERLGSYARPAPVDRDGALQRLLDLARCSPPQPREVALRAVAEGWTGSLKHSAGNKRIRIDARTGAITHVR